MEGKRIDSPPPFAPRTRFQSSNGRRLQAFVLDFKEMGGVGSRRLLSLFFYVTSHIKWGIISTQLFMVPHITNRCFLVVFVTRAAAGKGPPGKGETGNGERVRGETGKWGKGKALGLGPGFATSGSFLHFTPPPIAYSKRLFVAVSLSLHELILLLLLLLPNE